MSPSSFPPQAPSSDRPPSLRRVLWGEFPDLIGTISRLRLLAPRRASLRFLRSALPPPRPPSLPRNRDDSPRAWTISIAAPAPPLIGGEDEIIPGSWATLAYMPRSSTPADPRPQATTGPAMWSSAGLTASTPQRCFRGSITRPARSLCTLRSRGHPRTTQHSIPAGGQP